MTNIVLDTNILLIALPTKSKYRPIFDALLQEKFILAVSTSILNEYVEILGQKTTPIIANNVAEMLLNLKNVVKMEIYFRWNLIQNDYDDNKFVDCAIAANAKFVVTNDKHFNELKTINFPSIQVTNADDFLKDLQNEII